MKHGHDGVSSLISELRGSLSEESARIAREFAMTGDGRAAVAQRAHALRRPRSYLLSHDDEPVAEATIARYQSLLQQCAAGERPFSSSARRT